ncbi:hypothetical protein HDU89_006849 [Geranomyces variabilis]|nr:hypothetical protein HDU89_006849 [Geranomyces variabilis]
MKLKAPVVSDEFLERAIKRMEEAERANKRLEEIDVEAGLFHWMSAVTIAVANHFNGALRNEAERSMRGQLSWLAAAAFTNYGNRTTVEKVLGA